MGGWGLCRVIFSSVPMHVLLWFHFCSVSVERWKLRRTGVHPIELHKSYSGDRTTIKYSFVTLYNHLAVTSGTTGLNAVSPAEIPDVQHHLLQGWHTHTHANTHARIHAPTHPHTYIHTFDAAVGSSGPQMCKLSCNPAFVIVCLCAGCPFYSNPAGLEGLKLSNGTDWHPFLQ